MSQPIPSSSAMPIDSVVPSLKRSRSNESATDPLESRLKGRKVSPEYANYQAYEEAMGFGAGVPSAARSDSLEDRLKGRTISIGAGTNLDGIHKVRFHFEKTASRDGSQEAREREAHPSAPFYMRKLAKPAIPASEPPKQTELRELIKLLNTVPWDYQPLSVTRVNNHYGSLRTFRRGFVFTDMSLKAKYCYRLAQAYFKRMAMAKKDRPPADKPDEARLLHIAIQALNIAKLDGKLPANSSMLARINRFLAHLLSLRSQPGDLETIQQLLHEGVATNSDGRAQLLLELSQNIRDKGAKYAFAKSANQEDVVDENLRNNILARLEELAPPETRAPTPEINFD